MTLKEFKIRLSEYPDDIEVLVVHYIQFDDGDIQKECTPPILKLNGTERLEIK